MAALFNTHCQSARRSSRPAGLGRNRGQAAPAGRARPSLESLEDRTLLATGALGSPDPTFGSGGQVTTDFRQPLPAPNFAQAVQANGKVVVAGSSDQGVTGSDFAVVRYNADG